MKADFVLLASGPIYVPALTIALNGPKERAIEEASKAAKALSKAAYHTFQVYDTSAEDGSGSFRVATLNLHEQIDVMVRE